MSHHDPVRKCDNAKVCGECRIMHQILAESIVIRIAQISRTYEAQCVFNQNVCSVTDVLNAIFYGAHLSPNLCCDWNGILWS